MDFLDFDPSCIRCVGYLHGLSLLRKEDILVIPDMFPFSIDISRSAMCLERPGICESFRLLGRDT